MQTTLYLPGKNKSFHMVLDTASDIIKITFGEIGKRQITKTRPAEDWDRIISEKKQNGYMEIFTKENSKKTNESALRTKSDDILEFLKTISRQIVNEGYNLSPQYLTDENIENAKRILIELSQIKELYFFNKKLFELFSVIPRKMSRPILHTARSERDFASVLQREYDLLDNLSCYSIEDELVNFSLTECCDKEKQDVLALFDPIIAPKISEVYLFHNEEQSNNFLKYVRGNNITNQRLLFHGSRNENWWSIINNGLKTNPVNVVISGKMFGNGIYFADSADKSAGYTSLYGARHTNGKSNRAFMGVYEVALGNSLHLDRWKSEYTRFNEREINSKGFNSVHAHKGADLIHDEMIVYNECACNLKYLIELEN